MPHGLSGEIGVSIRRADRCLVEVDLDCLPVSAHRFQSAVRIAVWLKLSPVSPCCLAIRRVSIRRADRCLVEVCQRGIGNQRGRVSIRRADRCLVEAQTTFTGLNVGSAFQSAVRIAVWLKQIDRACQEGRSCVFQSAVRIAVWLKGGGVTRILREIAVSIRRADRCLVEVADFPRYVEKIKVSIRRADRCLVEVSALPVGCIAKSMFQSAVRIAVWLKVGP